MILMAMLFPSNREASRLEGRLTQPSTLGVFARKAINGRMVCLEASLEQSRSIRDRIAQLTRLTPDPSTSLRTGLKIILRGTSQLQGFPAAIEAFKRAAAQWEAQIQTFTVVVIDVDFGQTLFGKQFDDDVVSVTDAQVFGGNAFYPSVRSDLISGPYSTGKRAFYNSLPAAAVPTDVGATSGLMATAATLRALGLIPPAADPDNESIDFGPPPAIGFNSKFRFDFDLSDGIDSDKWDFEAMALHEMGHALGLISSVGQKEMNSSMDVAPTMWDLFRIRPDASNDFSAVERILTSGGEQSFYAGGARLALSTGRPDGAAGDGRHPAHWKDDNLAGQYLGAMDPTIAMGEHQYLTDNDLAALDALGYRTKRLLDPSTVISLIPGQSQVGGMFAPPPGLGVLSHVQYSIISPPDADELRIDLIGNQDVDLYVRYGRAVVNQGHAPIADYRVSTDSNSETLVITAESAPPLRDGLYYIAVGNFGPGDADFTVTAQSSGGRAGHPPAIFNIRTFLRGDALEIDCAAVDSEGDFALAQVSLLDAEGRAIGPLSSFAIASENSTRIESRFTIGLNDAAMARQASVVLADRAGNRSAGAVIDFGKPDAGGLTLTAASFDGSKLKLKARGLAVDLELEINGRIVAPPLRIKANGSGSKLTVKGDRDQLALRQGANRIRVKNVNGWSNIFMLDIE
jgi:hypothetical protein